MKTKEEMKEAMYDKAIQAYHNHVKRYNTWMNYYAIFTGTLFLAYYHIGEDQHLVKILSVLVGYISSLCWLGSFSGYYTWLKSWTHVLVYHEKKVLEDFNPIKGKDLRLYSLVHKESLKDNGYSTQKITRIFICVVICAWLVLFGFEIYKCVHNCLCKYVHECVDHCSLAWAIGGTLRLLIVSVIIICLSRKDLLSIIDCHYNLKKDKSGYIIEDPS
jgi:hypothetical protein